MATDLSLITASNANALLGKNPVREPIALMVAPTDKDAEHNTIRPTIIPLACFKLEDISFEFDSSFPMPGVREGMVEFKKLLDSHPRSPASVFGHADPVGNDDYNKALSGRRAQAIYALLTRRVDLWEDLHTQAVNSGSKAFGADSDAVMRAALGIPAGDKSAPRKDLYTRYMDFLCVDRAGKPYSMSKTEFLGKGADAGLKADAQGCGEFNPVLMFSRDEDKAFTDDKDKAGRNAENAPNRRVMVLLFKPGAVIDVAKWPCPRVKEGSGACRKRFWFDAAERRKFQEKRREHEKEHDTFQCRFYDRLTDRSPCEQGRPRLIFRYGIEEFDPKDIGDKFVLEIFRENGTLAFSFVPADGVKTGNTLHFTIAPLEPDVRYRGQVVLKTRTLGLFGLVNLSRVQDATFGDDILPRAVPLPASGDVGLPAPAPGTAPGPMVGVEEAAVEHAAGGEGDLSSALSEPGSR